MEIHLVLVTEPIEAVEETSASFDNLLGLTRPIDVVSGRPDEEMKEPKPVGADRLLVLLESDQIALRLGHLGPVETDHPLGEQSAKWLSG